MHQWYQAEAEGAKTAGLLPRLGAQWGRSVRGRCPPTELPNLPDKGLLTMVQAEMGDQSWNWLLNVLNTVPIKKKKSLLLYAN